MQWSNLNEQMIEQFFQNSNSPSNAQISLNLTRTSRQGDSSNKIHRQISPRVQIKNEIQLKQQNQVNPQTDLLSFADFQIQKFDELFKSINSQKEKQSQKQAIEIESIQDEYLKYQALVSKQNSRKSISSNTKSIQNNILLKIQDLQRKMNHNFPHSQSKQCQNCTRLKSKVFNLEANLKQIELELAINNQHLEKINKIQIKQICQQLEYKVQNRLLNQRLNAVNEKMKVMAQKNDGLNNIIENKKRQIYKLSQEIEKFNLEKSTYHFKSKTLENRLHQMQKSKSLLLSAAKNSTTHSDFNITTNNNNNIQTLKSNQQQIHDSSSLIHTNQFNCEKSIIQSDDYINWFQKIKTIFLEKYKKQQKEYLTRQNFGQKKDEAGLKEIIANFKKGHLRYQIARSCKTIADYIKKNKQNFFQLIGGQQFSALASNKSFIKDNKSMFIIQKESQAARYSSVSSSVLEQYEQELKKAQKISLGLQSQISNLNNQLMTIKRTLIKQKQQKNQIKSQLSNLKLQLQSKQKELHSLQLQIQLNNQTNEKNRFNMQMEEQINKIQQQSEIKSQQIKRYSVKAKKLEQSQQKMELALKEFEYLLYKERKQKIKWFRNSIDDIKVITACRIKNKQVHQKHLPMIVHQFQGRVYVEKEKLSFKYDIVESPTKKSQNEINVQIKKIIQNLFYLSSSSSILSLTFPNLQVSQCILSQKSLLFNSISEIFKFKQSEKRFLQTSISIQIIQMTNTQIIDLLDNDQENRKILIRKDGDKVYLSNCNRFNVENEQEAKNLLSQAFQRKKLDFEGVPTNSFVTLYISIHDKRTKQKFQSKIIFGDLQLRDQKNQLQSVQMLEKDISSIWHALNGLNFNQPYAFQQNRLTYYLSECMNDLSKNMLIVNVQPTEKHKEMSIKSLHYGSSLKSAVGMTKQCNGYSENPYYLSKTPHQVSNRILKQNSSQNQIVRQSLSQNELLVQRSNRKYEKQQNKVNCSSVDLKTKLNKHRNSSSQHDIENYGKQKRKRTISRLSIC